MKSKNLFLIGSFLMLSCLVFNVHANEYDIGSDDSSLVVSTTLDDNSNDSGRYSIGDGDIMESNLDVDKEKEINTRSKLTDANIEPKNFEKKSDVNIINTQSNLEPKNHLNVSSSLNYSFKDNANSVDKIANNIDYSYDNEIVNSSDDLSDNNKNVVGKLIELSSLNKPIGKITRLKSSLPSTGVMNAKQFIVASFVLMLTGLISLLYGFSRKYLGWYYDVGD